MENLREFATKDFYISALLKALGFGLLRLEKTKSKFVVFVFSDPQNKAPELIQRYWNRQIKIEPRTLIEQIHELKSRIHGGI